MKATPSVGRSLPAARAAHTASSFVMDGLFAPLVSGVSAGLFADCLRGMAVPPGNVAGLGQFQLTCRRRPAQHNAHQELPTSGAVRGAGCSNCATYLWGRGLTGSGAPLAKASPAMACADRSLVFSGGSGLSARPV